MIITTKKIKTTTVLFFVSLMVVIILIIASVFNLTKTTDNLSKKQDYNGYVLKEYNNKIAVFTENNTTPIEVFEVEFSSLPYSDQQLLLKGIKTDDLKKIYQIAEDFDG